jgi:hypothetical protein
VKSVGLLEEGRFERRQKGQVLEIVLPRVGAYQGVRVEME